MTTTSKANAQPIERDYRRTIGRTYADGRTVWERELRGEVTRGQAMGYVVKIDHLTYVGTRDGQPFSLVAALDAVRGCGNASVLRPNGTKVGTR